VLLLDFNTSEGCSVSFNIGKREEFSSMPPSQGAGGASEGKGGGKESLKKHTKRPVSYILVKEK